MAKRLYIECESGISGDMSVAALLDLGADEEKLRSTLDSFGISDEFDVAVSKVKKSGLDVCDFDVLIRTGEANHDHDMEYLYGHNADYMHGDEEYGHHGGNSHVHGHGGHEHHQGHHHGHQHEHEYYHEDETNDCGGDEHEYYHEGGHHVHSHIHGRGPAEIAEIYDRSSMTDRAKEIAKDILDVIADAEAKVHGVPRDKVHFHEVGAVDSIVDIASFAICLDDICEKYCIDGVCATHLSEGYGTVRCQHGILPVPVPAVAEIIRANNLKIKRADIRGELVTPTGAAIVAAVAKDDMPDTYSIERIGLGAGKREYGTAGFVRMMIIDC